MSVGTNAKRLYEIGKAFAEAQCKDEHLPRSFDV
jgi:hypothetical protein